MNPDSQIVVQTPDILKITTPGYGEFIRIAPDGKLFWKGREVETDTDFRAAMLDIADALIGKTPRSSGPSDDAKDAERYRWLRVERDEQQPVVTHAKFSDWGAPWRDVPLFGDELDAKVDQAMAEEQHERN